MVLIIIASTSDVCALVTHIHSDRKEGRKEGRRIPYVCLHTLQVCVRE